MTARGRLLRYLARHGYHSSADETKLASGQSSHEYLDCSRALCWPEALDAVGEVVYSHVQSSRNSGQFPTAIGGLTMGADPIAMSASLHSLNHFNQLRYFSVRKSPKDHGQGRQFEGIVLEGEWVVVVEDVVRTGGSAIRAIQACRDMGLNVAGVTVLVDRQQDHGMDNLLEALGPECWAMSVFTLEEVRQSAYTLT